MNIVFLATDFYSDFSHYQEILVKDRRPYLILLICINNKDFGIPFRTYINHPNCFRTSTTENPKAGLDYTKSIIITDKKYIDTSTKPILRNGEYTQIKGKEHLIRKGFDSYIKKYINSYNRIKNGNSNNIDHLLTNFSSLKNYHNEIGL